MKNFQINGSEDLYEMRLLGLSISKRTNFQNEKFTDNERSECFKQRRPKNKSVKKK